MNIAIGTRHSPAWRVEPRSIFVALGGLVVVAVAVALGAIVFRGGSSSVDQSAIQRARMETILAHAPAEAPNMVFYIVGSEADRDVVLAREDEASWVAFDNNFNPVKTHTQVLIASDPAQEAEASRIIGEASTANAQSGNKIEVYDLRK